MSETVNSGSQPGWSCGIPIHRNDKVQMSHGGGGRVMRQLIQDLFIKSFKSPFSGSEHDSVALPVEIPQGGRLAFTTDSYVVKPLFFPGGDIGSLSVHGTVNDLAMSGARPLYLSLGLILEEGLPMEVLERVIESVGRAARDCGVLVVTGDTKVVERGKGDGIFINTSGVGVIDEGLSIEPASVRPGDAVLVSGDLGRHGIAIMAAREGIEFETSIESDSAPLARMVRALLAEGVRPTCLRDLTRGGLAAALNEIASGSGHGIAIDEGAVPVLGEVRGACEMLGLDPLYVANEGRMVAFVPEKDAERALSVMRNHEVGRNCVRIGTVAAAEDRARPRVVIRSALGVDRILDLLSGEQLPRIC